MEETIATLIVRRISPTRVVITSPDLPGLYVHGKDFVEAAGHLPKAVTGLHEIMVKDGKPTDQKAAFDRVLG